MSMHNALRREAGNRVEEWLAMVERVPREAFTEALDFEQISGPARADSWFWSDSIFAEDARPHDAALGCWHGFHVATADIPDLLRHEYKAQGLDLIVTESRNFVLVQVAQSSLNILALSSRDRAAAIERVARLIFRESDAKALTLPPRIDEGTTFSSNVNADPARLACWNERLEGGIRKGSLYFLCYKKTSQRAGYENAMQWFDDEFRRLA
jgi:hypothetical protein